MKQAIFSVMVATALSACAVGPDYVAPNDELATSWAVAATNEQPDAMPDQWWSQLGDDGLDRLLVMAAQANLDIGIARARVEEARALRGVARSGLLPQAEVNARYTQFEQSIESPTAGGTLIDAGLIPRDVDFYTSSLDASWEIDIFGARRRQLESANAQLGALVAEYDAVRLAALSETAAAYFELRGAQERLDIAESNVAAQGRTLELTRRKVDAGLARRVDVLRAEAQWNAARAVIPGLRATIRASNYRLAVLTGQRPEAMRDEVVAESDLPAAPEAVPVGLRADILRRRPDIVAAERQLAAATAEIGVAKADFFPRLVLSGSYGFEAPDSFGIGDGRARTTAVVPFVRWPVFQGGRLRANLEGASARARGAVLAYEKAVLQALADAESAIVAYTEEAATYVRLDGAAEASIQAADIAERLYEQGLADFLTVLDAQARRDEAADARALSQTRLLLNLARVYKALGGGWQV